jgi:hypothetical protein
MEIVNKSGIWQVSNFFATSLKKWHMCLKLWEGGLKLVKIKIEGPILWKEPNMGTKTVIKPKHIYLIKYDLLSYKLIKYRLKCSFDLIILQNAQF